MNSDDRTHSHLIPFDPSTRELGVLVGYDGSENATRALHYAARAARRRGTVLTVATVYRVPVAPYTSVAEVSAAGVAPTGEAERAGAEALLSNAADFLSEYEGEVVYRAIEGDSVGAMADLTGDAELAIVGARGRGGFFGGLLGSVASALPAHTACPIIVVPSTHRSSEDLAGADFTPVEAESPVVVGVDDSDLSRVATLHAAAAAKERNTSLKLLIALPPLDTGLSWYPAFKPDAAEVTGERRAELEKLLERDKVWLEGHFPGLSVTGEVRLGDSADLLNAETESAQLTVMGTRGRGAFMSALLGSTSRAVLFRAKGPVMVVPNLADDRLKD